MRDVIVIEGAVDGKDKQAEPSPQEETAEVILFPPVKRRPYLPKPGTFDGGSAA